VAGEQELRAPEQAPERAQAPVPVVVQRQAREQVPERVQAVVPPLAPPPSRRTYRRNCSLPPVEPHTRGKPTGQPVPEQEQAPQMQLVPAPHHSYHRMLRQQLLTPHRRST
jgi:hypothetical protein